MSRACHSLLEEFVRCLSASDCMQVCRGAGWPPTLLATLPASF